MSLRNVLRSYKTILGVGLVLVLSACGEQQEDVDVKPAEETKAYKSSYKPYPSEPTILTGGTILTGTGERIDDGAVYFVDGKIAAVGPAREINVEKDARVIDLDGKWVTPGIVDNHSHLGVYPSPSLSAVSDGNEMVGPNTANVWAEHAVWAQDAGFTRALAGGVTTIQILPGSGNIFGGRSVVLKNVPSRTAMEMKFPGAPHGLKMACGENPKGRPGYPETRMGIFAHYREAFNEAKAYDPDESGSVDLTMETLAGVLDGDIKLHIHCYRADDMAVLLELAKEFDFQIASFHHAVEGYKIADLLAEQGICGTVWADWWGFKLEALDMVPENAALIDAQPNGCAVIHSDSSTGIQILNQEAAKAMASGLRRGMDIPPERAIKWITSNSAKTIGVDDVTGSLEVGKMADITVWNQNPFSVFAKAEQVFIDGALLFDRNDPALSPRVDLELGLGRNGFRGGAGQ